jgi:hypothetical protein
MDTKYPEINIPLVGEDGNAFSILGRVQRIMRQNDLAGEFTAFQSEATAGDYDHLLRTVMSWFSVDEDSEEDEDNSDNCGWCDELHSDCEC